MTTQEIAEIVAKHFCLNLSVVKKWMIKNDINDLKTMIRVLSNFERLLASILEQAKE